MAIEAQTTLSPATTQADATQKDNQTGYHLNVQTRIVVLDVVVTDKRAGSTRGLTSR